MGLRDLRPRNRGIYGTLKRWFVNHNSRWLMAWIYSYHWIRFNYPSKYYHWSGEFHIALWLYHRRDPYKYTYISITAGTVHWPRIYFSQGYDLARKQDDLRSKGVWVSLRELGG